MLVFPCDGQEKLFHDRYEKLRDQNIVGSTYKIHVLDGEINTQYDYLLNEITIRHFIFIVIESVC